MQAKHDAPLLLGENLVLSLSLAAPLRVPRLAIRSSDFAVILSDERDAPPKWRRVLLKTLAGDRRAERGHVFFLEQDLGQCPPGWARRHGLLLVDLEESYDPESSVETNLLRSAGSSLPTWLFRFLPLGERLPLPAGKLPAIEQRWLAIGCALASRPRLLLLDRPLEGLPPMLLQALLERLVRINLEEGIAFCFTAAPDPLIETAAASVYRLTAGLLAAE